MGKALLTEIEGGTPRNYWNDDEFQNYDSEGTFLYVKTAMA